MMTRLNPEQTLVDLTLSPYMTADASSDVIVVQTCVRLAQYLTAVVMMICRYRRLYNAAIKDRAVTYAWFFIAYLMHIAFCVWSAIAPPLPGANTWSHTGFIACVRAFNASKFVGVLYTIGGVLWALESLWSLWVVKTVSGPWQCTLPLMLGPLHASIHGLIISPWSMMASQHMRQAAGLAQRG